MFSMRPSHEKIRLIFKFGLVVAKGSANLRERLFFDPADVRAGDVQHLRDLSLRFGRQTAETVPKNDDLALARRQNGLYVKKRFFGVQLYLKVLYRGVLRADDVTVRQRIAVLVNIDRFAERNLGGELLLGTKKHEDFVRYPHLTARR